MNIEFEPVEHTVTHQGDGLLRFVIVTSNGDSIEQYWTFKGCYNRPAFIESFIKLTMSTTLEHTQEILLTVADLTKGSMIYPKDSYTKAQEELIAFDSVFVNGDHDVITNIRKVSGDIVHNVWKLDVGYKNEAFTRHIPTLLMHGGIEDGLDFLVNCATIAEGPVLTQSIGVEDFAVEGFLNDIAKRMFGFLKPSGKGKNFRQPTEEDVKRAGGTYAALEKITKETVLDDKWLDSHLKKSPVAIAMPFTSVDELIGSVTKLKSDISKYEGLAKTTNSNIEGMCTRIDAKAKEFFKKNGLEYTEDTSLEDFIEKELKAFAKTKTVSEFYTPKWVDVLGNSYSFVPSKKDPHSATAGTIEQTVHAKGKTYKDQTVELSAEDVKRLATAMLEVASVLSRANTWYVGDHFENYDYLSGEYYDSQSYAIDMLWDQAFDQYWWEFGNPIFDAVGSLKSIFDKLIEGSVK